MPPDTLGPPLLPGFEVVEAIGRGGFADVYLYKQLRPQRHVAVKVLRRDRVVTMTDLDREADVMAAVSQHPYIVTIFLADVAPDGRPFIVMEHYPRPHFGLRARSGDITVTECVRVGVQLASAVETAHRAGILHRDIKPANILTSAFGRPGLTDFGIAGLTGEDRTDSGDPTIPPGLSVAWAPREAFTGDGRGGPAPAEVRVTSDVYSLAASLWAFLAGHAPQWVPGGDNSDLALMGRAIKGGVRPLRRADVPRELEDLLVRSLSTEPSHRPATALELALRLQEIERGQGREATPIEVLVDATGPPPATTSDQPDLTRVDLRIDSPLDADRPPLSQGVQFLSPDNDQGPDGSNPASRRWLWGAAAVLAGAAMLAALLTRGSATEPPASAERPESEQPGEPVAPTLLAPPRDLRLSYDEATQTLTIEWSAVIAEESVRYRVVRADPGADGRDLERFRDDIWAPGLSDTEVALRPVPPEDRDLCVRVVAIADRAASAPSATVCGS